MAHESVSETVLRHAVDRLQSTLGPHLTAIVLYGSHARGEARKHSDVDLLVIARNLPERRYDRSVYLHSIVRKVGDAPPFSILGKTPEEFEGYSPSLYLDIGLDGIVLYDRNGYTADRLRSIRQIIDDTGLVRTRLPAGNWYWNWQRKISRPWELTWKGFRELA